MQVCGLIQAQPVPVPVPTPAFHPPRRKPNPKLTRQFAPQACPKPIPQVPAPAPAPAPAQPQTYPPAHPPPHRTQIAQIAGKLVELLRNVLAMPCHAMPSHPIHPSIIVSVLDKQARRRASKQASVQVQAPSPSVGDAH
ncbi:hypothetical protein EYC84_005998 [Monilinia fructicola]|uniref:Uncharacterized protein n=1 Tax=Monilinia fructicola TaxID=38448 RepID=A0A5M9K2A0_MONFR|nr:hypothetical protein EYC84_005998 [Monilinia fructicola]